MNRVFLFALLILTGCGGSGNGPGSPQPVTVTIPALAARDGYLRSDGPSFSGSGMFAGDFDGVLPGVSLRAVVGFDLAGAGVPPGATILSATLALYESPVFGLPHTELGALLGDHVDLGPTLDPADYAGNTLLAAFGVLSPDAAPGVKTLDVGARVQADLAAGRTFSDYRLRFATGSDGDGAEDYVRFDETESPSLNPKPTLTVTYLP